MTQRTITIRNGTGYTPSYGEPIKHFDNAIGYLSGWALATGGYTYVEISIHSTGDLAAAYWRNERAAKDEPRPGYFLFGQRDRDTDTYNFHS
jgi:hypothetical protein